MTAGRLLAERREQEGVHLAALAATLKVPVGKLRALEEDRYEIFPDVVFLRALASSVCRHLKMDAGPVLALLPQGAPVKLKDQQGLNQRFKETVGHSESVGPLGLPISRVTALAVIVLLAAALVIAFVPRGDNPAPAQESEPLATDEAPAQALGPNQSLEVAPGAQEPDHPLAADAPATAGGGAAPAEVASPGAQALASSPGEPAAVPQPAAAGTEPLVIVGRGPTWVQVRDASGTVLAERTLEKGDRIAAQGNGPWSVVIGRADAADVTVRGQSMDLSAIARSNVARFEVK